MVKNVFYVHDGSLMHLQTFWPILFLSNLTKVSAGKLTDNLREPRDIDIEFGTVVRSLFSFPLESPFWDAAVSWVLARRDFLVWSSKALADFGFSAMTGSGSDFGLGGTELKQMILSWKSWLNWIQPSPASSFPYFCLLWFPRNSFFRYNNSFHKLVRTARQTFQLSTSRFGVQSCLI